MGCRVWSPDFSFLDFYFWGHMKTLTYDIPVDSVEDLIARIAVAAGEILGMHRVL